MKPVHVMVVDDSAVVRQVVAGILAGESGFEVTCATDPLWAMERMKAHWPDVILLDVEMPRMDGITFLRKIMAERPHILWAGLWLGIAFDAFARASSAVRGEARKTPGTVPMKASHLARLSVKLQTMRNDVQALATEFDRITALPNGMEELLTVGWALKMNNLKVGASEAVQQIVHEALQIIGINGFKNDSKVSVGRHYRDALSAALMISNDRIYSKTASMLLVYKDD